MDSIGNYKILRTIVEKGPSRICVAEHKKLGRKTFLKIYSGADADLIQRFEREARIVAELNHESIVSIYDFGESEGKYYISMEYIEGCNLAEFLKSSKPAVDQIINFSYQISKSVSILHEKGYIHRDLKPENILIDQNNIVKITDFGIAFHEALNHVTNEGNVLGTPLYMSPEQINNVPLNSSSDVFSLGIIFYQMAAGFNPFRAERFGEIFSKILTTQPESLKNINLNLPDWFVTLVEKMLFKDPQKRLQNAKLVVEEILSHKERNINEIVAEPEYRKKEKIIKSVKWKLLVPFTALIILLCVFLYSIFGKKSDEKFTDQLSYSKIDGIENIIPQQISESDSTKILAEEDENNNNNPIIKDERSINNIKETTNPKQNDLINAPPENVKSTTTFFVETWPWCRIYLNYEFIDESQMKESKNIKPGRYLLSLQNPNYPTWSDSININPNQSNTFSFNLDSIYFKLTLNIFPWGEVYIDGKHIGTSPVEPVFLSRKNHFIQIKNEYYETWQDSLFWNGENQIEKKIDLKK